MDNILDAQCPYHKDMCHTLRNCRDFKHSVENGRPFQPLPPPPPQGGPGEPRQPQQQEGGGGGAFSRVDGEVNVIFGGHGSQENKRQQKLNDRQILVVATSAPAPYLHSGGSMAQLRSSGQVPAPHRSSDLREQGKKGVGGRGKQHQRHLTMTVDTLVSIINPHFYE